MLKNTCYEGQIYKYDIPLEVLAHIKGTHEGLKYLCNDCDYKATTRSSFLQHIKAVHKELKL